MLPCPSISLFVLLAVNVGCYLGSSFLFVLLSTFESMLPNCLPLYIYSCLGHDMTICL